MERARAALLDDAGTEVWTGDVWITDSGYVPVRPMLYKVWRRALRWVRLPSNG